MSEQEEIIEALSARPPFDQVGASALATIAPQVTLQHFAGKAVIQGRAENLQGLFILREGQVRIVTPAGTAATLVPGEAFPIEALEADGSPSIDCDYIADTPGSVLLIPLQQLAELRHISPVFRDFCRNRSVSFHSRERRLMDPMARSGGLNAQLSEITPASGTATVGPKASVREAIDVLYGFRTDALTVLDEQTQAPLGIFTLGDLLARVLVLNRDLSITVESVMTPKPFLLPHFNHGFDAAVEMARRGIRHVVVTHDNRFAGLISDRDLFAAHQSGGDLNSLIRKAESDQDLEQAAEGIRRLGGRLVLDGVDASRVTHLVSTLNDRLVERIVEIRAAEADVGLGEFCWIALGSEGRHEQTLCTDQDNALIFKPRPGEPLEASRERMVGFAREVNWQLHRCGFPLCSGNIMASNPLCCLTAEEWSQRFSTWLAMPDPDALLNATIYFDLRPLCGNRQLCLALQTWLAAEIKHNARFLHLMTENASRRPPPIGFFRDFVVDKNDGKLDLKLFGTAIFVDGARIFGLAASAASSATLERIAAARECGLISTANCDDWTAAFDMIQSIRLRHHHMQIARNEVADNRINPYALNNVDRKAFLESLRHASAIQKAAETRFGLSHRT
ncbi:MAG TPA: DUF294 nucleotidyltransferase-like domain-containing protein [Rhodocyclaceae bacterium]